MADFNCFAFDNFSKLQLTNFIDVFSKGGIPGKLKGRIGDAPLVGCGGYANKSGAATASGHGEAVIKMTLAREIVYKIEKEGQDAQVMFQYHIVFKICVSCILSNIINCKFIFILHASVLNK